MCSFSWPDLGRLGLSPGRLGSLLSQGMCALVTLLAVAQWEPSWDSEGFSSRLRGVFFRVWHCRGQPVQPGKFRSGLRSSAVNWARNFSGVSLCLRTLLLRKFYEFLRWDSRSGLRRSLQPQPASPSPVLSAKACRSFSGQRCPGLSSPSAREALFLRGTPSFSASSPSQGQAGPLPGFPGRSCALPYTLEGSRRRELGLVLVTEQSTSVQGSSPVLTARTNAHASRCV